MGKKKNITKVDLRKEVVELTDPRMKEGTLFNSAEPMAQHILFVPDDETEFTELKYQCSGKLYSYRNGTVEFVRTVRKRTASEQLMRTQHGLLSKTSNDYYLCQIRIPIDGRKKAGEIIRNECNEMADCF